MTTGQALEGFGHLVHVDGYLAGRFTTDRRYTFESSDAVHYQQIKYAARTVGDRVVSNTFATRGGFASRVVTRDGYNAGTRTAPTEYNPTTRTGPNSAAANMIEADVDGVTHVFACVSNGFSDDGPPAPDFSTALPDPEYTMCWMQNTWFSEGAFCRPTSPNTFVYEVTDILNPLLAPLTAYASPPLPPPEPTWPTTLNDTINDGNIQWTCRADPQTASLVNDGTVVWQCLGPVPQYSRTGYIAAEGDLTTTTDALTALDTFMPAEHAATHYKVTVSAFDDTNADAKFWELEAFVIDTGAGPSFNSAETSTVTSETAGGGAAAWTAYFALSGSYLFVNILGENGKTIRWKSQLKMSETL